MRRMLQRAWVWFLTVFGIFLTIVLFLFQARVSFLSLTAGYVVLNTILAVLIAQGATLVLVLVPLLCWRYLPKFGRRFVAAVALWALSRALRRHNHPVQCIGIGSRVGSVVIRLGTGFSSGVAYGTRFRVTNTATGELWGIIEAIEVDDASCTGIVFIG